MAKADSLTPAVIDHHLSTAANAACICHTDPWYAQNGFVAPCGHVITCDPAALKNCPPADVQYLFMSGTKHRPDMLRVTMSADVRNQILSELEAVLDDYRKRNDGWAGWCDGVLAHVRQQLHSPMFADGKVFTNTSKPHAPGTRFVPFKQEYNALLRRLHYHFVVTTADKLANNYVIVCKSYYVQQVWADLNGPDGFYSRLQSNATDTSTVHDRITDALFNVVTPAGSGVPCMYSTDTAAVREEMSVVPYEAALVKLHKTPVALRFLACSAENGLRRPAVWLTSLFRAVCASRFADMLVPVVGCLSRAVVL
jgi:hypothetical protein